MLINFASTWKDLLKHSISGEFLLMERYVIRVFRKNLCSTLIQLLWESLTDNFYQYFELRTKSQRIEFGDILQTDGLVQGDLIKVLLLIAPFVERFKKLLWESLPDKFYRYREKFS